MPQLDFQCFRRSSFGCASPFYDALCYEQIYHSENCGND